MSDEVKEPQEESTYVERIRAEKQKIVEDTIISFVNFYRLVNREELKVLVKHTRPCQVASITKRANLNYYDLSEPLMAGVLYRLNVGDCYVAALAVGEALRQRGVSVTYCDNDEHGFLLVSSTNNKHYDTLNPQGVTDPKDMLGMDKSKHNRYDSSMFAEKHLPDDHYGKAMVETFVRMYRPNYIYPFKISDRESEVYV